MSILARAFWQSTNTVIVAATVILSACAQDTKTPSELTALNAKVAAMEPIVADLEERKKIHEVYIHYGRGIDRLDETLYRSAFWPDAQINYGTRETITVDQHWNEHMIKWHKGTLQSWGHLLTNETADIDGDVAHVEIYVTPMWVPKDEKQGKEWFLLSGRYIDRLERRNGEWRIAVREFIPHFAMKVNTSNYREVRDGFLKGATSTCALEPWAPQDTSYVRPLLRRTDLKAGPPCATK